MSVGAVSLNDGKLLHKVAVAACKNQENSLFRHVLCSHRWLHCMTLLWTRRDAMLREITGRGTLSVSDRNSFCLPSSGN
jgi:hypothetical protein